MEKYYIEIFFNQYQNFNNDDESEVYSSLLA